MCEPAKTVTQGRGPKRPFNCLDHEHPLRENRHQPTNTGPRTTFKMFRQFYKLQSESSLLKESQEARIYHLSESNAFFVFRFMRKFLSCQNMFRFFLRQKRRSAFSQRTPFCLWSWWLRLNSLWLIQWSINRIVTDHHCDYDNSLFYYWSKKA